MAHSRVFYFFSNGGAPNIAGPRENFPPLDGLPLPLCYRCFQLSTEWTTLLGWAIQTVCLWLAFCRLLSIVQSAILLSLAVTVKSLLANSGHFRASFTFYQLTQLTVYNNHQLRFIHLLLSNNSWCDWTMQWTRAVNRPITSADTDIMNKLDRLRSLMLLLERQTI